jgi:hypothetical protein
MQFRIKHLLVATAVLAAFAAALRSPSNPVMHWFCFVAWLTVIALVARAITHAGRERMIIAVGLTASISYLALVLFVDEKFPLPSTAALKTWYPERVPGQIYNAGRIMTGMTRNPIAEASWMIGEIGFAALFGLSAAGLAAYWTRSKGSAMEVVQ